MKSRPARWLARGVLYGSLVGFVTAAVLLNVEIRSEPVRARIESQLNGLVNRKVTVGRAYVRLLGEARLEDVVVENPPDSGFASPFLLRAPSVDVAFRPLPGGGRAAEIETLRLVGAEFHFERLRDGPWNTDDLWRARPPGAPVLRPFQIATVVENGRVEYADGEIGESGVRISFADVTARHLVFRTDSGVFANLDVPAAKVEGGGDFGLVMTAAPPPEGFRADIRFTGVDIDRLRPFYDWLKLLRLETGRADFAGSLRFRSDGFGMEGNGNLHDLAFTHPASGTRFPDEEVALRFRGDFGRETDAIDLVELDWRGTKLRVSGGFSARRAPHRWCDLRFVGAPARAQDILFLIRDERLAVQGDVRGTYRYIERGGTQRYEIQGDLAGARAGFGEWIAKSETQAARIFVEGPIEGLPRRIEVSLPSARIQVLPTPGGGRIRVDTMTAEELFAYIPLYRDRISKRMRVGGRFSSDFTVDGDRQAGLWNFTQAVFRVGGLKKPLWMPSRAYVALHTEGRETIAVDTVILGVGEGQMRLSGLMGERASTLSLRGELGATDLAEILPLGPSADTFLAMVKGKVGFLLDYEEVEGGNERVGGMIDLTRTDLEWGLFSKRAGAPLRFTGELHPSFTGGTFDVGRGRVFLRLRGRDMEVTSDAVGGERLLALLAMAKGLEAEKMTLRGPVSFRLQMTRGGGLMPFRLTCDLTGAEVGYEGVLAKPVGVPLRLVAHGSRGEARILFSEGSLILGNSRFLFSGTTSTVLRGSLDLEAEGEIDARELPRLMPVLATMKVPGAGVDQSVARALATNADRSGQIRLVWHTGGTIDRPEVAIDAAAAVAEAFANSLRRFFPPVPRR